MMYRFGATIVLSVAVQTSLQAKSSKTIFDDSQAAIVYLSVRQVQDGAETSHGTGFLVTRDGYIVTVAHVRADRGQYLEAVIGGTEGVHHNLGSTPVAVDNDLDVAVWRLQQALPCRPILTIAAKAPEVGDRVEVIGFPGSLGMTPDYSVVQNLYGPDQEYVLQGGMEPGQSGAPVLNEGGDVIGIFRGGHPASGTENHVVSISVVVPLLAKYGATPSVEKHPDYPLECYASCESAQNGVAEWKSKTALTLDSGWLGGGHNQDEVCGGLQASWSQAHAGHSFLVNSKSEESHKDVMGHVEYRYHCSGFDVSDPKYRAGRSPACGLWSRTGD